MIGQRILIVGPTGAGKSTLGIALADLIDAPHIELDSLFWEANWTETPDDRFVQKLEKVLEAAGDRWVVSGNYRKTQSITWPIADTLIWMDYPFYITYWRLFWRTVRRVFYKETLWNGNRETFRNAFLSRDSLLVWAWGAYGRRKRQYKLIFDNDDYPHLRKHRLKSPRHTKYWFDAATRSFYGIYS